MQFLSYLAMFLVFAPVVLVVLTVVVGGMWWIVGTTFSILTIGVIIKYPKVGVWMWFTCFLVAIVLFVITQTI